MKIKHFIPSLVFISLLLFCFWYFDKEKEEDTRDTYPSDEEIMYLNNGIYN